MDFQSSMKTEGFLQWLPLSDKHQHKAVPLFLCCRHPESAQPEPPGPGHFTTRHSPPQPFERQVESQEPPQGGPASRTAWLRRAHHVHVTAHRWVPAL